MSYPVCVDGYALPAGVSEKVTESLALGQSGSVVDAVCPNVICLPKSSMGCSATPYDTLDFLPPVQESPLDSNFICNADTAVDGNMLPNVFGMNLGIAPHFDPVIVVKLNISGRVMSYFNDQCVPVIGAKIVAWQVNPTALGKFATSRADGGWSGQYSQVNVTDELGGLDKTSTASNLRDISCSGMQHTDVEGGYRFMTTVPPSYGPPRHIMVSISAPGFQTLTTRVYFDADWRLQQLTTLHGQEASPYLSAMLSEEHDVNTADFLARHPIFPGSIGKDPRVARLQFRRYEKEPLFIPGTVTGEFFTSFDFVLTPTRTSSKPAEKGFSVPPQDINGFWVDNTNGGLISVETTGSIFTAVEYPHARQWGTVFGSLSGDAIRGVNFRQIAAVSSEDIVRAFTPSPHSIGKPKYQLFGNNIDNIWTKDVTVGTILFGDPFKSDSFSPLSPISQSIRWSGGGYEGSSWSRVVDHSLISFRFLKLVITRETGGYDGGVLRINEIQFFDGILAHEEKPTSAFKMITPRSPSPQMVTCSSYKDQETHCYKAFDGNANASSCWITQVIVLY